MYFFKVLAISAFSVSTVWCIFDFDFESVVSILTCSSAVLIAFRKEIAPIILPHQKQKTGKNSVALQAGGDGTFQNINVNTRKTEDAE